MPIQSDIALGRLLGYIYTETFQRRSHDPNKPLTTTINKSEDQPVLEETKSKLWTNGDVTVWGPHSNWRGGEGVNETGPPLGAYLVFDGASGDGQITDFTAIQNIFDTESTIEFLIFAGSDGEGDAGRILDKIPASGGVGGFRVTVENQSSTSMRLFFTQTFDTTDGVWATNNRVISTNTWHHISIKYDNSSVSNNPTFRIDGVEFTIGSGMFESTTPVGTRESDIGNDLYVGNNDADSRTFDGRIDEIRIWSDSRTDDEVDDNANGEIDTASANLVAYYRVEEITGTVVCNNVNPTVSGEQINLTTAVIVFDYLVCGSYGETGIWRDCG